MPVSVPIDDIAGAWNNYLKNIRSFHAALEDLPLRPGPWPNWLILITNMAERDFGITILTDNGRKLDPYTDSTIGALEFAEEAALTQFLLKFSD